MSRNDEIKFELPPSTPRGSVFESPKDSLLNDIPSTSRIFSSLERLKQLNEKVSTAGDAVAANACADFQEIEKETSNAVKKASKCTDIVNGNGIGKIQPEFYSSSVTSQNYGSLCCSLLYDGAVETLTVKVVKIKHLQPRKSKSEKRDAFVRVFLLPDEINYQQTITRQKSNNPTFNEEFRFSVPNSNVLEKTMLFSVYDEDKKNSICILLGHALISLVNIDLSMSNDEIWENLGELSRPGESEAIIGNIRFSLTYAPLNKGKLKIFVSQLKDLNLLNIEVAGIYIKVCVYNKEQLIKSKKTSIKSLSSIVCFNELISFNVNEDKIKETSMEILVMARKAMGRYLCKASSFIRKSLLKKEAEVDHVCGHVTIGGKNDDDMDHWREMISRSGRAVAKWHSLRKMNLNLTNDA